LEKNDGVNGALPGTRQHQGTIHRLETNDEKLFY
jgi:hypothetical protein